MNLFDLMTRKPVPVVGARKVTFAVDEDREDHSYDSKQAGANTESILAALRELGGIASRGQLIQQTGLPYYKVSNTLSLLRRTKNVGLIVDEAGRWFWKLNE